MKTFNGISVDSGCIMMADLDWVKAQGWSYPDLDQLVKVIEDHDGAIHDLPVGDYYAELKINNTYNGNVGAGGLLHVTSGKIVVIDPCYVCDNPREKQTYEYLKPSNSEAWTKFCEETNYGDYSPEGIVLMNNMGGDGEYTVHAEFRKLQ
jgi:hypothetical protein